MLHTNSIKNNFTNAIKILKNLSTNRRVFYSKFNFDFSPEQCKLATVIQKYKDKLLYSGYVEEHRLRLGYKKNMIVIRKRLREEAKSKEELQKIDPLPLSLTYLYQDFNNLKLSKQQNETIVEKLKDSPTHFPFDFKDSKPVTSTDTSISEDRTHTDLQKNLADLEVKERLKYLNANNWMVDYENYEEDELQEYSSLQVNYGTTDPNSKISNIPCGGCGAYLHCKDTSIPGYIPVEIYKNHECTGGTSLKAIICQRCYFLKNYNLALQVQVAPEDYPQVLKTVRNRERALVILIVDLLDFPSSIWPGAADLLGPGRPIILVGNKVDLLPQDGKGFLERVAQNLKNCAREHGLASANIEQVCLVSATTGYGIEDLITKLYRFWETKGDVFLVGCTNVGKSSLFNALLQSDYCKSQATDLIQRATVSLWPGTTLNLLKFPILRMSGYRAYMRYQRLKHSNKQLAEENKLRRTQLSATRNPKYASLIGHIDRTFSNDKPVTANDVFSVKGSRNSSGVAAVGIYENDKVYALSKWCYDTPGVVQPEQLLHLLTAEELLLTLSKELIRPQTYCLHPGSTIFIGGLSRLDYLEGDTFLRFTVFCSNKLPVTICKSEVADDLYEEFLGTEFFAVPCGTKQRLKYWPGLKKCKEFTVKGGDWKYSCADVVLSSSGWIGLSGGEHLEYRVKAWVPADCGIHLRDSLLPLAVTLRGKRIRDSPAYATNRFYVKQ